MGGTRKLLLISTPGNVWVWQVREAALALGEPLQSPGSGGNFKLLAERTPGGPGAEMPTAAARLEQRGRTTHRGLHGAPPSRHHSADREPRDPETRAAALRAPGTAGGPAALRGRHHSASDSGSVGGAALGRHCCSGRDRDRGTDGRWQMTAQDRDALGTKCVHCLWDSLLLTQSAVPLGLSATLERSLRERSCALLPRSPQQSPLLRSSPPVQCAFSRRSAVPVPRRLHLRLRGHAVGARRLRAHVQVRAEALAQTTLCVLDAAPATPTLHLRR